MVSRSYMTKKPAEPSALQRYFDWRVMPAAINAAGAVEEALERVAARARDHKVLATAAALTWGFVLGDLFGRRSGRPRRVRSDNGTMRTR